MFITQPKLEFKYIKKTKDLKYCLSLKYVCIEIFRILEASNFLILKQVEYIFEANV